MKIIQLFWGRSENAIHETELKYGKLLKRIAFNIVANFQDSEECVNDTYMTAWNTMPPQKPNSLMAYLGRITRNISINRYHSDHAQKRGGGLILDELTECVPDDSNIIDSLETNVLTEIIEKWLYSLDTEDRDLFIRKYWFGDSSKSLAKENNVTESVISGKLFRLRNKLKDVLTKEEIYI